MDLEQYNQLHSYLTSQTIPSHFNNQQRKQFLTKLKQFKLGNNLIFKINKNNPQHYLRVVRRFEMEAVLYMTHNDPTAGHFSEDAMFNKLRTRYYWPQMYENIREYVRSCDACQRRGKPKRNEPLHPIPVGEPFHQIGIDIVGPLP